MMVWMFGFMFDYVCVFSMFVDLCLFVWWKVVCLVVSVIMVLWCVWCE